MSRIPESQWELLDKALAEQEQIGWHLAMRRYLSQQWVLAIAANPCSKEDNDRGKIWTRKTILQLWEFSREMWEHRNSILHDSQLKASHKIQDAQINDEIMKLYAHIDNYDAANRWYFELPLALRLRRPLRSRRRWLMNARILVDKSVTHAMSGQTNLTTYFPHQPASQQVVHRTLGLSIQTARTFMQTNYSDGHRRILVNTPKSLALKDPIFLRWCR